MAALAAMAVHSFLARPVHNHQFEPVHLLAEPTCFWTVRQRLRNRRYSRRLTCTR